MRSFKKYLLAKFNNSVLIRYEHMCNALQNLFNMPVAIVGLHTSFKNAVSGIERDIRNITPRCVLEYSSIDLDKGACTSIQAATGIRGVDSTGQFGDIARNYRRLPLTGNFKMSIVLDDPALAIRLSEYIGVLAFVCPICKGDEHTTSTIILSESTSIEHDNDKNIYTLSCNLQLNMQVLEPVAFKDIFTVVESDKIVTDTTGAGTSVDEDGTSDDGSGTGEGGGGDEGGGGSGGGGDEGGGSGSGGSGTGGGDDDDDDIQYPLQGVGVLMPDGTWNTTEYGELLVDSKGNPILDANGEYQYGNYIENGWYRLHIHFHSHAHDRWYDCMESDEGQFMDKPSGYEILHASPEVREEISKAIGCNNNGIPETD